MNFESIKLAKDCIKDIIEELDFIQEKGYVEQATFEYKLSDIFKIDLADFIMYLIASDRNINMQEVDVFRYLTGFGGETFDSIKNHIENNGVMSYDFQSKIPISLQIMVSATNKIVQYNPEVNMSAAIELYIFSYVLAGKEIMRSDERVSYQERRDYELYISNLISYVNEHSYARFKEPLTKYLTN